MKPIHVRKPGLEVLPKPGYCRNCPAVVLRFLNGEKSIGNYARVRYLRWCSGVEYRGSRGSGIDRSF